MARIRHYFSITSANVSGDVNAIIITITPLSMSHQHNSGYRQSFRYTAIFQLLLLYLLLSLLQVLIRGVVIKGKSVSQLSVVWLIFHLYFIQSTYCVLWFYVGIISFHIIFKILQETVAILLNSKRAILLLDPSSRPRNILETFRYLKLKFSYLCASMIYFQA